MSAFIPLWLLLTTLVGVDRPQQPVPARTARQVSLDGYLGELDRIRERVESLDERRPAGAAEVLTGVPAAWSISVDGREFEASADWIRQDLMEWRSAPLADTRALLVARLRAVRGEAARYRDPVRDVSAEHDRLRSILTAREFRGLEGPNWLDRLKHAALTWLINLIDRRLGSSSIPTITNLMVYGAIAILVILVARIVYRSLRQSAELDPIRLGRIPQVARPWTVWLADARAAAGRSDWPEAVHLAYWCGIAFLEERGAWRPDRSRTPREYLRVIGTAHAHRPALQTLTRELERVWYAAGGADRSRFDAMLGELEKLGCPSR